MPVGPTDEKGRDARTRAGSARPARPASGEAPEAELAAEVARLRVRVAELTRESEDASALRERLRASEARYRMLVEQASDAIVIVGPDGRIREVNAAGLEMLGYAAEELRGLPALELADPAEIADHPPDYEAVVAGGTVLSRRRLRRRDGSTFPAESSTRRLEGGGVHIIIRDVTRQVEREEELRDVTHRMNVALRAARIGTWSWDARARVVVWDDYALPLFGLEGGTGPQTLHELVELVHPDDREQVGRAIRGAVEDAGAFEFEFRIRWPDGSSHTLMTRGDVQCDDGGRPRRATGVCWDVTERRRAEEQVRELAYFDPLTGLANRTLFQERLSDALERANERGRTAALLFLDLDDFKDVNDTLGHAAGDAFLQQVARRLLSAVRLEDVVGRGGSDLPAAISRLGGDEFTLLLGEISAPEDAARVAARVLHSFAHPFEVAGHEVFTRASIGIAVSPADGRDAETLLRNADTAMYHAKRHDRGGYTFYDRSMNEAAARRREIEVRLRHALEAGGFTLHYQPILDARSRQVVGAEALVRLADAEHTSPADFIPVAEESGLIGPLGDWVLRSACDQVRRWRREGFEALRLAVNVSGHQLRQRDFTSRVVDALLWARLPPERLVLEITESVIMQDDLVTSRSLHDLHEIGVSLALDDFGTGYSSLSYLRRFPLRSLKIDRSFVSEVATNENDAALTGAILRMAQTLGVRTVAEGVERQEHVEFLLAHGCDEFQGYLFSRPVPPDSFLDYARKQGVAEAAD